MCLRCAGQTSGEKRIGSPTSGEVRGSPGISLPQQLKDRFIAPPTSYSSILGASHPDVQRASRKIDSALPRPLRLRQVQFRHRSKLPKSWYFATASKIFHTERNYPPCNIYSCAAATARPPYASKFERGEMIRITQNIVASLGRHSSVGANPMDIRKESKLHRTLR
jgi:hypothetical protein